MRIMKSFTSSWLLLLIAGSALTGEAVELRVMSFNLWNGGDSGKQPLSQTAKVIRAAQADIVGVQETGGWETEKGAGRPDRGRKLAGILGWHYYDQGAHTAILSRHPIVTNAPGKWGVSIRLPSGRLVWMFNVHLPAEPYQPYQLAGIPYANAPFLKTAEEAVAEARKARGAQVERLLCDLKPALKSGQPVFLTGDFNEPSHLDWTARAVSAGRCPIAVEFPSTFAVTRSGMRDAFRTVFSDEVARPGLTWTPTTRPTDPKDRHDRLDFVFFAGGSVKVKACEIVGESGDTSDIVVYPYPSDHRSVVATMELPE